VKKEKIFTIPNLLSISRLVMIPILYYLSLKQNALLFGILYFLTGATDALDGFLARLLKQETRLGVVFDEIGDYSYYLFSVVFMYLWNKQLVLENLVIVGILLFYFISQSIAIFLISGRFHSLHLYTQKLWGFSVFLNVMYYVLIGDSYFPLYFLLVYGTVVYVEVMYIVFKLNKNLYDNVGSIFLMRRKLRKSKK
jgi:phosphatidylglycerophosphate synthase